MDQEFYVKIKVSDKNQNTLGFKKSFGQIFAQPDLTSYYTLPSIYNKGDFDYKITLKKDDSRFSYDETARRIKFNFSGEEDLGYHEVLFSFNAMPKEEYETSYFGIPQQKLGSGFIQDFEVGLWVVGVSGEIGMNLLDL
jgi:hypothetical protein